jgi:hypothetical protein
VAGSPDRTAYDDRFDLTKLRAAQEQRRTEERQAFHQAGSSEMIARCRPVGGCTALRSTVFRRVPPTSSIADACA